jgi:hypothetical protein
MPLKTLIERNNLVAGYLLGAGRLQAVFKVFTTVASYLMLLLPSHEASA